MHGKDWQERRKRKQRRPRADQKVQKTPCWSPTQVQTQAPGLAWQWYERINSDRSWRKASMMADRLELESVQSCNLTKTMYYLEWQRISCLSFFWFGQSLGRIDSSIVILGLLVWFTIIIINGDIHLTFSFLLLFFLDAIASPSAYFWQWVSESISDW